MAEETVFVRTWTVINLNLSTLLVMNTSRSAVTGTILNLVSTIRNVLRRAIKFGKPFGSALTISYTPNLHGGPGRLADRVGGRLGS